MTTPTLQPVYGSYTTLTKTLASLATSSTFVAGRELPAIDNSSALYDDFEVSGKITVGTTPTVNTSILLYAFGTVDDTPTWPDVFGGTDAAKTLTSAGVGIGFLKLLASLAVDSTTSDRAYPFVVTGLAGLFGMYPPKRIGLFVTHNTGVNFNSTESNHIVKWRGFNWAIPSV